MEEDEGFDHTLYFRSRGLIAHARLKNAFTHMQNVLFNMSWPKLLLYLSGWPINFFSKKVYHLYYQSERDMIKE